MASFSTNLERASFVIAVISGIVGAVSGGSGWTITSIVAGCLAAAAAIAGRFASQALDREAQIEADAKVDAANQRAEKANAELDKVQNKLAPRRLSDEQTRAMEAVLKGVTPFELGVHHNRREAEPKVIHSQITKVFERNGFEVNYYGGMTNAISGIGVSGPHGFEKSTVIDALNAAGVRFEEIVFTGGKGVYGGVEIWVGTHPGLGG